MSGWQCFLPGIERPGNRRLGAEAMRHEEFACALNQDFVEEGYFPLMILPDLFTSGIPVGVKEESQREGRQLCFVPA
jgi:hypothetical protein